jgi:hypothetical protein
MSRSRLETETNEKLADVYQRLLQAGVDRTESEREAKLKETLASLQRIFPGERCPCYPTNPIQHSLPQLRRSRARDRPLQADSAQIRDSCIRYPWAQHRCCHRGRRKNCHRMYRRALFYVLYLFLYSDCKTTSK